MKRKILKSLIFFFGITMISLKVSNSQANYETTKLRDPFAAPEGLEQTAEETGLSRIPFTVELKGIIMEGNKKYAVLNDNIVKEKESWRGITIEKIEKDYISVIYGGKQIKIPFIKKEG
ncbi:MAG: hypothetical protein WC412_03765 [Candidatus Omnitrophota bacterium]